MTQPYVVKSPSQLDAIASPGREEVIDAVAMIGPCSVTELAQTLQRTRHSLYYHVQALRDAGLLIETQRTGEGVKSTAYFDVPGRPLSVSFDLGAAPRRTAVRNLARSRIRTGAKGFERACHPGVAVTEGPHRNLWATHIKGMLSAAELEEANQLLGRLIELFGRDVADGSEKRTAHELTFVVAPFLPKGSSS